MSKPNCKELVSLFILLCQLLELHSLLRSKALSWRGYKNVKLELNWFAHCKFWPSPLGSFYLDSKEFAVWKCRQITRKALQLCVGWIVRFCSIACKSLLRKSFKFEKVFSTLQADLFQQDSCLELQSFYEFGRNFLPIVYRQNGFENRSFAIPSADERSKMGKIERGLDHHEVF